MFHLSQKLEHFYLSRGGEKKKSLMSLYTSVVKNQLPSRRRWFHLWVRKMPWRRKWQPTPVFLPRKSHFLGHWHLAGYSPWDCKYPYTVSPHPMPSLRLPLIYFLSLYICFFQNIYI